MSSPNRDRLIGPSLRPDDVAPATGIGPAIPVALFRSKLEQHGSGSGPEELEDLSTIGPLIPGQELGEELRHLRSDTMTNDAAVSGTSSGIPAAGLKRESWMTQMLPVSNANVAALKARRFQRSVGGSGDGGCDRSWFKTPMAGDTTNDADPDSDCVKQAGLADCEKLRESAYNQKMSEMVGQCQVEKTQMSLLELHRKKLEKKERKKEEKMKKKKQKKDEEEENNDKNGNKHKSKKRKKEHKSKHKAKHHKRHRSSSPESEQPVRRPFDREKDLKISRIDSAARNALIERSKQLSSRFGHGSRQFL